MHQFTSGFKVTCAVFAALIGGISCAPMAYAQPADGAVARNEVAVTSTKDGLRVNVRAQSVKASQVIEELAKKTSSDFIIYDDAEISSVKFEDDSPFGAFEKVAAAAGLSVRLEDKTYIIGKLEVADEENNGIDLYFRDMPIRELLSILQKQFDLKIEIAPQISGNLVAINLNNETPTSAVEKVARGAKLSLTKTEDGVYRVGFDNEKSKN